MFKLYKNLFKRFYGPDYVYFIVAKTFENFPYFKEPLFCELLIEEIKLAKKMKNFKLYGFSIIYDHLNLMIKPGNEFNISQVMHSIKRNFSWDVNFLMGYIFNPRNYHPVGDNQTNPSPVGDNHDCRLQEGGDCRLQGIENKVDKQEKNIKLKNEYEKFKDDIIEFDKKLSHLKEQFNNKYSLNHNLKKFKWQKSFYDDVIRNDKDFEYHLRYTNENHLKHLLPENWPYHSANYPDLIDDIVL